MLLQFYILTIHIKYTLTQTHTHTTQPRLSMWIWAKEYQTLKIKSTPLHNKTDSTKPNNHILSIFQVQQWNQKFDNSY